MEKSEFEAFNSGEGFHKGGDDPDPGALGIDDYGDQGGVFIPDPEDTDEEEESDENELD